MFVQTATEAPCRDYNEGQAEHEHNIGWYNTPLQLNQIESNLYRDWYILMRSIKHALPKIESPMFVNKHATHVNVPACIYIW